MRILFMGTPDFAVASLEALVTNGYQVVGVVTQPDRPKGRGRQLMPPPVKEIAQKYELPVFQPEKVRQEEALAQLEELQPDLLVTAAYGQLLPQRLLDMPKFGSINVHASLLPKHRGGAPIHRAIINGDKQSGVTIMRMVQALDAGAMLSQVAIPIDERDTVGSLHDKLACAGAKLLLETIPKIADGSITETEQDESLVTYSPNISRDDERIDWTKSARAIYNQVRGLNPWPVSFTTSNGKIVKIWWVDLVDETTVSGKQPGTVLRTSKDSIEVQTGKGIVAIRELQPEGKRKMKAEELLRGQTIEAGYQFGDANE
ncbi:methionyl-tRNA formyltransferase [Effusibacillus dendaii]|uniref:Methionyl-tRNA formyltransferase n=1 Tax=Effusibacillus dendaii TaxID=2743772 RepID=A0A7I8D4V5_9BACL|nr:methionyl-tRNA formyltransferase [Effusibacillus dendaii]BCJ85124.1 methionyl-tRNA formyltransferase [Effusibacillus dendaii]